MWLYVVCLCVFVCVCVCVCVCVVETLVAFILEHAEDDLRGRLYAFKTVATRRQLL